MADNVTNELLLEPLKAIQARMTSFEHGQAEIRTTLVAMQQHMSGFMTHATAHENAIAHIQARLDCIEKRLELSDKV